MAALKQKIAYETINGLTGYQGVLLEETELNSYLPTRVKGKYNDVAGAIILTDRFADIAKTEFENKSLIDIFTLEADPIDWKIGECLAECYLEDNCQAKFPYANIRDAKNPKSNQTGADIVGLDYENDEVVFIFGEVKTSSDKTSPPNVLYGKSGMIYQLEIIKEKIQNRDDLVRWLAHKVSNLPDEDQTAIDFKKALKLYIGNKNKIKIVGVLVRDTEPKESDLKSRYGSLANGLEAEMKLRLLGLYLPVQNNQLPNLLMLTHE